MDWNTWTGTLLLGLGHCYWITGIGPWNWDTGTLGLGHGEWDAGTGTIWGWILIIIII